MTAAESMFRPAAAAFQARVPLPEVGPPQDKKISIDGKVDDATELIASLQQQCTDLKNAALESEEEAAQARNNARNAMEVANRYSHRSYNINIHNNTETVSATAQSSSKATSSKIRAVEEKENHENINSSYDSARKSEEEDVLALLVEITSLKEQLNVERRKHKQALDEKEAECSALKQQVDTAEEDATTALEIAKEASRQKQQLEQWLHNVLEENESLKVSMEQQKSHQNNSLLETTMDTAAAVVPADTTEDGASFLTVQHEDEDNDYADREGHADATLDVQSVSTSVAEKQQQQQQRASSALVAYGRDLLMKRRNIIDNTSGNANNSQYVATHHHYVVNMEKLAERRQGLLERIRHHDDVTAALIQRNYYSASSSSAASFTSTPNYRHQHPIVHTTPASNNQGLLKLLKDSAERLQLGDSFILSQEEVSTDVAGQEADIHNFSLDAIATSYCNAVEVSML